MFENDFEAKFKEKIELANLLVGLSDKDTNIVYDLYHKKKEIMKKNSLFAGIKVNKINKQINKIINKYDKQELENYRDSLETNSIFEKEKK